MIMAKEKKTMLDADETILDAEAADTSLPDDVATVPDDATVLDGVTTSDDGSGIPVTEKGASLLDTYRIESDAIEGGMGAVWRVHHTGWNVDLAMKRPKAGMFQTEKQKENLSAEIFRCFWECAQRLLICPTKVPFFLSKMWAKNRIRLTA